MARQSGIIRLSGTLDGITFFETRTGHFARRKSSLTKHRLLTDPQFARTRENSSEFGIASRGYSLLRRAFLPEIRLYRGQDHRKLFLGLMLQLKDLDTVHPRGQRTVATGLQHPDAAALFAGLNFNGSRPLGSVLFRHPDVDAVTGETRLSSFVPGAFVNYPVSASHVELTAFRKDIDFATHTFATTRGSSVVLALDDTAHDIVLAPTGPELPGGIRLTALQVRFFQELNGELYPLKNEGMGAMGVVGVLGKMGAGDG